MRYFDDDALAFLGDLKRHNDRAWFNEHKDRYERSLRQPFLDFISDVGPELRSISSNLVADPRPSGGSLFRIHRDVRFSRDKSPYKTHAGAHFQLGGKGVHGPGYYLHLEPGGCFVAGGMWMPEPEVLLAIRRRIADEPAAWKKGRGTLDPSEETLKRPPRGFDADHPMIEDIKRKSFTGSVRLTDKQVTSTTFMATFVRDCDRISPLMRFLASASGVPW
ncbi:MAG TPA: DUF2461 domain-containing protein [Actinomycetota bacterium]|nr:DUF2461 domain-containing protein [Actinomycetota bacterium]